MVIFNFFKNTLFELVTTEIYRYYSQKLKKEDNSFCEKCVCTSFGKTNIIITNNVDKPPLILLHGLNSAAPFAIDLLSFLTDKYQIFAVDILGQPNKSEFTRLTKKGNSYGKWLLEVVDKLDIINITFCGISFGVFPIIKSLLLRQKKVKEVFFISPVAIIHGSLWKTVIRFLIPLKKFQKTKNALYLKKCLLSVYDEFDELTLAYQKEVFLNFNMDFSITPNFKKSALKKIKVPVSIVAADNDFFVPPKKLQKRIENLLTLKHFFVLKNSNHIPKKAILQDVFNKITS